MENGIGTVGVTDYAQVSLVFIICGTIWILLQDLCGVEYILTANIHILYFVVSFKSKLGDIVYVQLPDVGDTVTEGGKNLLETLWRGGLGIFGFADLDNFWFGFLVFALQTAVFLFCCLVRFVSF